MMVSVDARRIGFLAALSLVALRLGIGWHFFQEGAKKFTDGFTARHFLQQAKGPLADAYLSMIPDREGRQRLSRESVLARWHRFRDQAAGRLGFDDTQKKKAEAAVQQREAQLDAFFAEHGEEINQYFLECDRLQAAKADASTRDVEFRREWITETQAKLQRTSQPWLADVTRLGELLQRDINALAMPEQARRGPIQLADPGKAVVDNVVKYGIVAVGAGLILGLFTRLASLAGILFLASVLLSQPFWVSEADTTVAYYQMIEILALFVLLAFAAGRYGGLDFFLHSMRMRCCPPSSRGDDDA